MKRAREPGIVARIHWPSEPSRIVWLIPPREPTWRRLLRWLGLIE
jgi:hypothetical protein